MRTTRKLTREVRQATLANTFWKSQNGGGIISVNGVRYDNRVSRNGNTIVIHGGRTKGRAGCFLLLFEPDSTVTLQGMKQAPDCALDPGGSGRHMINAALKIAMQRHATQLTLSDISQKHLPSGKSFKLADMYFMTTGKTWYETMIPGLQPETKQDKIPIWREKVHTASWDTIESALREQVPDISIPVHVHDIDTSVPGTAMLVLSRIKDAQTEFFALYEDELINAFKIGSLFAITWAVSLTPPSAGPALRNPL